MKNIRTWVEKLNIIINIINIIKFINIMKIKKNTIEKNIHLILREKSFVIILINLGQASSSKPKKIGAVKVCVTHVAECGTTPPTQGSWLQCPDPRLLDPAFRPKSNASTQTKYNGSIVGTQFSWVLHQDPRIIGSSSGHNFLGSYLRTQG